MELKILFEQAVEESKTLPDKPSNDTLLQLYSLYKQSIIGDINVDVPNQLDFLAKAKYDAWKALEGTSKETAMQRYINLVNKLKV